jgi:hypothetical protein
MRQAAKLGESGVVARRCASMSRLISLLLLSPLALSPLLACQVPDNEPGVDSETSETNGEGDGDGEGGDGDGDSDTDNDTGSAVFNCDPSEDMPCPDGQKCTVLLSGGAPVYDCVPDDTGLLPFEECTPAPMTGQDQCPDNHVCIAPSPDSQMGLCLQLCTEDEGCDAALCVAPPDSLIPVCAAICDPLAPLCPGAQDCQRVRQRNFVCQYPRPIDTGSTADPCDIVDDAGCAEGFVCETGDIIPECAGSSCCTALCDVTEPGVCPSPTVCGELDLDPQPGLENVGACYVPQ